VRSHASSFSFAALGSAAALLAQQPAPAEPTAPATSLARLDAFVVGSAADASTRAWADLLKSGGIAVRLVERAACSADALRTADLVVVDWPAAAPAPDAVALGPFERWDRPTLLAGDAGRRFAATWGLPSAADMEALPAAARGPEMEPLADALAGPGGWRQGNLFHLPPAASPAEPEHRDRLLRTARAAARFVTDRPILRHAVPAGYELPPAERARRERITAACAAFAIGPHDLAALLALPLRLDGPDARAAATLLVDLVPDSRDADTSKANWLSWLKGRSGQLVWDPLSLAWRVDLLAYWRDVPSVACRGEQRADGQVREPEAEALAAKVVQRHGGRALADLAVFSCWRGEQFVVWDRARGYFRIENHHQLAPGVRATAWKVAVIDTATDREVIQGGGPPPRPRVSARGAWRELVEHAFLPALLLDPGTSLRRVREHDGDGLALGVRLAGRGMDLTSERVLLVDANGDVLRITTRPADTRPTTLRVAARAPCGPLLLLTELVEEGRRPRTLTVEEPRWNPDVHPDIATAEQQLSLPRAK
jgi:hypothetical protein